MGHFRHPPAMSGWKSVLATNCRRLLRAVLWVTVLVWHCWAAGAIYWLELLPNWVRVPLAVCYFVVVILRLPVWQRFWGRSKEAPATESASRGGSSLRRLLNLLRGTCRPQPGLKWLQQTAASVAVIYLLTTLQSPSNDRDWVPENSRIAEIHIVDDDVQVRNFRHAVYRSETDVDVHFHDMAFPLSGLDKVWFVVQRFTALEGIAHNFLTFRWQDESGPHYFSVSVEIRRELGETFSPVKGLYRQYELIYIVADERDEIGSRTVLRPSDRVFLYAVNATPKQVQALFLDIADRIDKLQSHPEFYHSLLNNCTNSIVEHTYKLTPEPINWLDPRIVAPGFADRFAFANDLIGSEGQSFDHLRTQSRIDLIAREVGFSDSFSADIRRENGN